MNCIVSLAALALVAVASATTLTTTPEYEPVEGMIYDRCVEIRDVEPCKGLPDRIYAICGVCHLGYKAHCENEELTIRPCELTADPFGNKLRKIFDFNFQACLTTTSTCPGN